MTTGYADIRAYNERRYGWDGGLVAKEYADDHYDHHADRTYFILEPRHLTAEEQNHLALSGVADSPNSGRTEP